MNLATNFNDSSRKWQDGRRYVLRDRDGDYVTSVDSSELATTKLHFTFSSDPVDAYVFTYADLYDKNATNAIGIAFACGFSGGRAIRVDELISLSALRNP
jgi:hypothetical protein